MPPKGLKMHHIGLKMDWEKMRNWRIPHLLPLQSIFAEKNKLCNRGYPPPLAEKFSNIAFDGLPKVNKCMIMLKPGCKK